MLHIQHIQHPGKVQLFYVPVCDSTQLEIQRFIELGGVSAINFQSPVVLYADEQTHGRGQQGNHWFANAGENLLMSIAFPLNLARNVEPLVLNKSLTAAIALGLESVVDQSVHIKWPNDMVVKKRKLAGILMELVQINQQKFLILGLGVNVNQMQFSSDFNAISVKEVLQNPQIYDGPETVSGRKLNDGSKTYNDRAQCSTVMKDVIDSILKAWDNPNPFLRSYDDKLYLKNKQIVLLEAIGQKHIDCKLLGVNEVGQICVTVQDGSERCFHHGEVRMVFP